MQEYMSCLGSSCSWCQRPVRFDLYIFHCRANPVDWKGSTIYFRGLKVLQANLAALLHAGMNSASEVILTGCSAGGLATYLHTDYVKSILPSSVKYRAMADAG